MGINGSAGAFLGDNAVTLGIVVLIFLLMLRLIRRGRKSADPMPVRLAPQQQSWRMNGHEASLATYEVTREIRAELETRLHHLEALIVQADARIEALERLLADAVTQETLSNRVNDAN